MKKLVLFLLVVGLLAAGGAAAYGWHFANTPSSDSPEEVVVEIPKGASVTKIATLMEQNGLVRDATLFRYYVRARDRQGDLRAGEFRLRKNLTPSELLDTLVKGEIVLHKLTVPEGLTAREIAAIVQTSGLGAAVEFEALTNDAAFARGLGVPADRLEGYLYPDTYNFAKGIGARGIAEAMVKRFQEVWTPELQARAKTHGLDAHEAVILASIVEKETGDPAERGIIAGVFYNRLKKGMKLETDPTIIYGMTQMGTYAGNIRRPDIRDPKNLWNTYVIKGLPPTPIANPGGDALRAVAYPNTHDWLFFVAKGPGSKEHVFTATYKEHLAAVKKYQLAPRRVANGPK